jgi:hypothetical protein
MFVWGSRQRAGDYGLANDPKHPEFQGANWKSLGAIEGVAEISGHARQRILELKLNGHAKVVHIDASGLLQF